jgi:hypothetical protein
VAAPGSGRLPAGPHQLEALARFVELREQLAQEAALVSYLIDGQETSVRMAHTVRVLVGGMDGLAKEVPTHDVLEALRDEVVQLEGSVLVSSRIHPSFEGLGAPSPRTGDAVWTFAALPETTLAVTSA